MAYRDILLPLLIYPEATPTESLATAAVMARRLQTGRNDGEVTALVLEAQLRAATNRLADLLVRLDAEVEDQNRQCLRKAREMAEAWRRAADAQGLRTRERIQQIDAFSERDRMNAEARTHDICLFPMTPGGGFDQTSAEVVLFGSGRPILVFPEQAGDDRATTFRRLVVAWDGSRAAARALADAMPLVMTAERVQVVSVLGEKPSVATGEARDVIDHLARHAVDAQSVELQCDGAPIGDVLRSFVRETGADLLVMGGFGHGRMREFLLGGATVSLLRDPGGPVLLSH